MSKYKYRLAAAGLALVVVGASGIAVAELLGNLLGFPRIVFASGNTNITGSSGSLTINAAPVIFQESSTQAPVFVNPVPGGYESFDISIALDGSCSLVGSGSATDLLLVGEVDLGGGDVRSGTLLTGNVLEFGFLDAGLTDLFDFRFQVTGGALADFYTDEDLGVLVASESSDFTGNCSADSTGEAKGTAGAIPPILPADGCTPGYWKQRHHFDSWVGYSPTDSFAAVFGRTVTGVTDLESALKAKGGGVKALSRHATAALLNVANPDVNVNDYSSTADVIAAFQAAFDSGDYELTKDAFESANEEGCPLN
jgi:hypothetical protein